MADINSLSFGCGNTLLANQLNIMADAIRSLITLVGTIGDKVGSYIPLSGSEEITGVLAPKTHEGYDLGKSTNRWGTVWASTGGFKTIDFYDLQTSNKLGTLEINVNNGRLQYDNKTIALLSDIVNINPGENVITTDGDSVNLSDYTVSCNNIICDNTIRAKQKGSFQKIIIGDDPDYSELNEEEHPIYATLEYNIFSRDPDDSSFEDNNLTISTVLLLGRGLYKGAPIHIDTNNEGLYVDGNLIIPLPPIEEDENYNTYLHVDENGSLEWVSASPGVGATSLSGLSDVSSYSSSDQGKYLKVKNDGTGTEWSDISLSDLSNTEIGGSNNALSNGLVLVYDLSLSKWKNTSLPANLPSVSGHDNEYLKVNNDGTLAEWVSVTPGSGLLWSDLTNNNTANIIHSGNLPKASSSALGIVKGDGLTVSINSSGEISVSGTLAGLNVESGTPSNGDILVYRTSSNKWKKESLPTGNLPSGGINGDHLIMGNNGPEWETSYNIYLVENGNKTLNGTITPQSTSNGGGIFIGTNRSGNIYSSLANPILLSPGTGGVQIANLGTGNSYALSTIKTSNDGNLILKSSVDTIIDTELGSQYIYLNGSRIYLSTNTSTNGHYLSLNSSNLLCYDGNVIGSGGGLTSGSWAKYFDGKTKGITPTSGLYLKWDSNGNLTQDSGSYTLNKATDSALGGIKTGYTTNANDKNYKVLVDNNGNAYVNVPWTASGLTSGNWADYLNGLAKSSNSGYLYYNGSTVTTSNGGSSSETFFFLFISLLKNRYNSKMIITQTQNSSHTAVTSIGLITEPTFIEENVLYMLKGHFQSGGLYFVNPLFRFNRNGSDYYLLVVVDNVSSPELVYCCVDGFNDDDAVYGYGTDSRTITSKEEVVYNISRYMINLLQTKYNITVSNSNGGSTASSDYMYSYSSTIQTVTTSNVKYYIEPNAASGQHNTINVSI